MFRVHNLIILAALLIILTSAFIYFMPKSPPPGQYTTRHGIRQSLVLAENGTGCFVLKKGMAPIVWKHNRWQKSITVTGHFNGWEQETETFDLQYDQSNRSLKCLGSEHLTGKPLKHVSSDFPSAFDWVLPYDGTVESLMK